MNKILATFLCLASTPAISGTYISDIKQLQAVDINSPFNTVYLTISITDSPCASTNAVGRFAIVNNVQQSAALAALMAGKKVELMSTGSCNSANIEVVNYIMVMANQ